jgi:ABC-type multidrug transport system fused ATPase/permease subunit
VFTLFLSEELDIVTNLVDQVKFIASVTLLLTYFITEVVNILLYKDFYRSLKVFLYLVILSYVSSWFSSFFVIHCAILFLFVMSYFYENKLFTAYLQKVPIVGSKLNPIL